MRQAAPVQFSGKRGYQLAATRQTILIALARRPGNGRQGSSPIAEEHFRAVFQSVEDALNAIPQTVVRAFASGQCFAFWNCRFVMERSIQSRN
jgi:hypothetical protein